MRGETRRLLPVILILVLSLFFFGCTLLGTAQEPDTFGPQAEGMNQQIYAASSASSVTRLASDVAALKATALNDSKYSGYLALLDAQGLTLQVLSTYFEFQSESAAIYASGIDCGKDYSSLISKLRAANSTANSAISKANSYRSSNPNSTANLLVSAINRTSPGSMAAYADLLEADIQRDCLETQTPPTPYALPLSYDDALDIASGLAGEAYFVYGFNTTLPEDAIVTAIRASGDYNFTFAASTWFFFLDSAPWAPFGHDVRYIMIDAGRGTYVISEEVMYPIINGRAYWQSVDERSDPSNILYPTDVGDLFTTGLSSAPDSGYLFSTRSMDDLSGPRLFSSEKPYLSRGRAVYLAGAAAAGEAPAFNGMECCLEKGKYAIILTGSNDSMFQADTARMYGFLKSSGYTDEDISYLSTVAGTPGSDAVTSIPEFAEALNRIIANAKCCDDVFIYLAGHGMQDPVKLYRHKTTGEQKWVRTVADLGAVPADWEYTGSRGLFHKIDVNNGAADGNFASSQELAAFIKLMMSCHVVIMYQSCFSGAAAPTLGSYPGVIVLTPVDGEHSSYGQDNADADWGAGSYFSQSYINAKTKDNATADKDRDGSVSEKEAFDHANKINHDLMEADRQYWQDKADAETRNPLLKLRYEARAADVDVQNGNYSEGGPCWCCHLNCSQATSWLCRIFEGRNKPNCPDCKKAGDYCGPDISQPPRNETPLNGTGNATAGNATTGNASGPTDAIPPVCGDGNKTGNEQCDYGSPNTNKCTEGKYCTATCECKQLETSVVCGDGKISSPNEDCDGGNVRTNICPAGNTCTICKCVPTAATCGDGRVNAPEECDHGNTYTRECPGGETCTSCRCLAPGELPPGEAYCGNNQREGTEECDGTDSSACSTDETCTGCACTARDAVCGDGRVSGSEECESNSHCGTGETCSGCRCTSSAVCGNDRKETGEECEENSDCPAGKGCAACHCITIGATCGDHVKGGSEECDGSNLGCSSGGVCSGGCTCVYPPSLDCDYICSQTSGAQSLGGSYSSSSECGNAARSYFGERTCYLTCYYAYIYTATNIAGSTSCCCAMKKEFPYSDCPGAHPTPPPESTCDANAPHWYSPP